MTIITDSMAAFSDDQLLSSVSALACAEQRATARLIEALGELDRRKLFLGQGCPSLFAYCTQVLHLSEHAAYSRIEAARAARQFPEILAHLTSGAVTLTAVCLLAPVLTAENHEALLAAARHKTKREVEHLVAMTRPQADVSTIVRKLPTPKPPQNAPGAPILSAGAPPSSALAATPAAPDPHLPVAEMAPVRPAVVAPLAPDRYKIQFTASRDAYEKLRQPNRCFGM